MHGFMAVILILLPCCFAGVASADVQSWGPLVDGVKLNPAMAPHKDKIVAQAREALGKPLVKRAKTLAEVGQNRTWLDGRANALEPEIRETFALAMSDFAACGTLADELPLLAAAYRLTGEAAFRDRVAAQLDEMAAWSPLQRPGWTLYHPGARLPADGKDGNWLATGCGVRAIAETFELMPDGAIDKDLRDRLNRLLESEVASIVDDWTSRRPWFVRSNNSITNQWVLPTEGLVGACLVLGPDAHREAYELGVKTLLQALDAHGPAGEFEEGFGYASFTMTAMLHAARAMAVHGDRRAVDHPFLKHFPTWLVHHFQPADMIVNCFDAGAAKDGAERSRDLLSLLVACTQSPVAAWALERQTAGPSDSLPGLAARATMGTIEKTAPPLFAVYDRARRVNWRDNWDAAGSGAWVRGGHPLDQHDHCDRGHVNFIAHGQPMLIEAGTPFYHHPLMGAEFASGVGHNVLQLGAAEPHPVDAGTTLVLPGWQPMGVVAPITVKRLDASGGDVTVEVTTGYDGLKQWSRHVAWTANNMTIQDHVELADGRSDVVLFRWHLGTNSEAAVAQQDAQTWQVKWPHASLALKASAPLQVAAVKLPDNTINTVSDDGTPDIPHTCIVVQSAQPTSQFDVSTEVTRTQE